MKLICNGNDLSQAVGKVYKAVAVNTTSPILEGIKLKAENGSLELTGTDTELTIQLRIPADVKIEGETVVPGRFFADFVKKLNHEQIELLLTDKNQLVIKYQESEGMLQCFNSQEYPQFRELNEAQKFSIKRTEFKDLIKKIYFSASKEDSSRPILKGVHLEITDISLTGVALDGFRLAKCVKPIIKTTAMMCATVPVKCIDRIAQLLDDSKDPVEISIQKNYLMVDLDHTRIVTRLLDGDFINYKQLIQCNFESLVTIPKELFQDGLDRAILLAKTDNNNLVRFDIKDNMLQLSSNSVIGNITEKIPVKLNGVDISIAFNAMYFTELLKYIELDNIVIKFTNSISPCVIVPSGGQEDFMYLILPVRMTSN